MKNAVAATSSRFLPLVYSLVVVLIVSGSGCRKKSPAPDDTGTPPVNVPDKGESPVGQTPAPEPNQADAVSEPDKVLVTVNGTPITEGQVKRRIYAEYGPELAKMAAQSPEYAAQQERLLIPGITQRLLVEQLLEEQARAANITITDEEVATGMTRQLAAQYPGVTLEKFREMVTAQGGDFQAIKEGAARSMKYNKLFEGKWADSITVADDEIRKYYDEHPKQFDTPEQVRASHILISTAVTDPNADPNQVKAQAREKAEKLLKEIKEGGDFAALAKEHSSCPSAAKGGDLGLYPRGEWVKPFENAAFALQVGEVSDVVETQHGYHIIKVTDRRDASHTAFEEAKGDIINTLTQQKRTDLARKYIESLKEQAKIVYTSGSTPDANQPATRAAPPTATPAPAEPNE